jgi:P27 family predicted phage terminase small subunit
MGKRGPKPEPTALKLFKGNPGKRPLNENEPKPVSAVNSPAPPTWLGEVGQAKWRELAPQLYAVGCLTLLDYDGLASLCEAHDTFHAAMGIVEKEGMVAVSAKGGAYQHPAVGIKNAALQRIRQLGNDFGMTPSARSSLKVDQGEQFDDLETFKSG